MQQGDYCMVFYVTWVRLRFFDVQRNETHSQCLVSRIFRQLVYIDLRD